MNDLAKTALELSLSYLKAVDLDKLDSAALVPLIKQVQDVCAFSAAIHAQIELRALANGEMLPGVVIKPVVKHRQWNDPEVAAELAREAFGDKAFSAPTLLSPAGIEKLGETGKTFVAMASFKPEAGKKVVY